MDNATKMEVASVLNDIIDAILPETLDEKRKRLNREASRQYREKKRKENTHLTTNVVDIEERKRRSNMKAAEHMRRMRQRKHYSLNKDQPTTVTTQNKKNTLTDEEKELQKDKQRKQTAERMRRMRERKHNSRPTVPLAPSDKKEHDDMDLKKQEKRKNKTSKLQSI